MNFLQTRKAKHTISRRKEDSSFLLQENPWPCSQMNSVFSRSREGKKRGGEQRNTNEVKILSEQWRRRRQQWRLQMWSFLKCGTVLIKPLTRR